MAILTVPEPTGADTAFQTQGRRSWRKFRRNGLAVAGLVIVVILLAMAIFGPVIAPYKPDVTNFQLPMHPPGPGHWLGTDELGRDLLSRILYGSQESLASGLLVVVLAMVIGVPLGLLAGYAGGWTDEIIMRVMDAWLAFPGLVLAMAIAFVLGPSLINAIIAIVVVSIPGYARITRGQAMTLKNREYVDAARAVGASPFRIMMRHILANAATPIVVVATLNVGGAILAIASLSFLGLGPPPPAPDWGAMVQEGANYLTMAPWISFFPGLAIFMAVMGFTILGDGIRDVFDPRS
jgi:peptide/nickel transport system permease protein